MPQLLSQQQWQGVLLKCGVKPPVAASWAPVFAKAVLTDSFSKGMDEIDDFLGQVLYESGMLEKLEEDLYYKTPGRLMEVWPSRFSCLADELPYLRNPEALANKVYGGRMGNVLPGDGWRHRGSGLIHVTGANNLKALQHSTGLKVFDDPELLRRPTVEAVKVVIAWWEGNVPDGVMGDVVKVTKKVNGGTIGLDDRAHLSRAARASLAELAIVE